MDFLKLAQFVISPRADCPQCQNKIEINQWNLVCGFKTENNSMPVKVDAEHFSSVGVKIFGICEKCTQKNGGVKTGVFINLSINEFIDFISNNTIKFIVDFNNKKIEMSNEILSKRTQ